MGILKFIKDKLKQREQLEYEKDLWFYVNMYNMRPEVESLIDNHMSLECAMKLLKIYPFDE